MTVAERTREAVRAHPFLYHALRAGVVNYTAAARFLDMGEEETVAAALRRYADDLSDYRPDDRPDHRPDDRRVRVNMKSGLDPVDAPTAAAPGDALLVVGGTALAPGGGSLTGVLATGDVGPAALTDVLARLRVEDIPVEAAGAGAGHLVVAVGRRDGPTALRLVEDALPTD